MEAYRDQYATLFNNGRNVTVIGISVDADTTLASWARDEDFPVVFASDPGGNVGRLYGAYDAKNKLDNRSLFVIRPDGRIAICKWGPPAKNQFFAFLTSIGANGVRVDDLPATDPVDDAIRATHLEVLTTGDLPAPIEMADDAALAAALSRAGIAAAPAATSVTAAAGRYRQGDGTYRFENRLRFWVLRMLR